MDLRVCKRVSKRDPQPRINNIQAVRSTVYPIRLYVASLADRNRTSANALRPVKRICLDLVILPCSNDIHHDLAPVKDSWFFWSAGSSTKTQSLSLYDLMNSYEC